MITILFWNLNNDYNHNRTEFLGVFANRCDIIVLVEASDDVINHEIPGFSLITPFQTAKLEWIKIFKKDSNASFSLTRVTELYHERIVIASLEIQGKKDIHLYGLHLNSKTQKDDVTQLLINNIAATEIHGFMKARHSRAILVGDFNHNPFDGFMTGRHTLNAVANKEIAKKLKTRSYNNDYDKKTIFYNPMWNLLGDFDLATGQAKFNGSFFYADERHKMLQHIHWNLFDQVLVSAPICDSVLPSEIKLISDYVDNVGITHSLAGSEFYEKRNNFHNPDYSDHLPLLFKVDETKL